ncbi:MAG: hypothetical protein ABSH20_06300 [Tepidisphaeraceae bacterium]
MIATLANAPIRSATTTGQLLRTYTSSTETDYNYDALGRLWQVRVIKQNGSILATPLVTEYGYDLDGNLTTIADPNGVTATNEFDAFNRLDSVITTNSTNHKLFEQDYTLLPDGQRASVLESRYDGTSSTPFSTVRIDWAYDNESRLVTETRDDGDNHTCDTTAGGDYTDFFTLDMAGNRLTLEHGWDADNDGTVSTGDTIDSITAYTYNSRDQLLAEGPDTNNDGIPDSSTAINYTYDDNGSMTAKGSDTYTWDLRGRMVTATVGGTTSTIGYDSDGQRVSEQTGTTATTYYVNDKSNPTGYPQILEERSGTSPANATFVRSYTIGLRVEGQADTTVGVAMYVIDGHGSTRSLLDSSGQELQRGSENGSKAIIRMMTIGVPFSDPPTTPSPASAPARICPTSPARPPSPSISRTASAPAGSNPNTASPPASPPSSIPTAT